jgi:type IV pilus assembly protein PilO
LFIVGVLAIGLVAVYQQLMWTPKNDELKTLAVRLDSLDSLNATAKKDAAKGNSAKMKAEADLFSRQLEVLRKLVPRENEVPALLESVSEAARRAGLELANVIPDVVTPGDDFDAYKYKLAIIGPYHEVGQFLANVGSLSRIVEPINVQLAVSTKNTERKAKKDEQLLEVNFQIQTYVAHPPPPPPTRSAKAGGAP